MVWTLDRIEADPCVQRFRGRMDEGTWVGTARYILRGWLSWLEENSGEFSGMAPRGLVAWQREHPYDYRLLDLVQGYVGQVGSRVGYRRRVYTTIRGLFSHNRVMLSRDPGFNLRGDLPPVQGSLSVGDFRAVLAASNKMYRAAFLCMGMGLMGAGELLYWSEHGLDSLRVQLDRRVDLVRVDLPGRKMYRNVKPFYTFLGRDAVRALREYMEVRPPGDSIFMGQLGTRLEHQVMGQYWLRKLRRLGLVPEAKGKRGVRYGKNLHEIRDLFRTRWRRSGVEVAYAEFFMGHMKAFDADGYDRIYTDRDFVAGKYMEAEPWLNILSEEPEKISRSEHELAIRRERSRIEEAVDMAVRKRLAKERIDDRN